MRHTKKWWRFKQLYVKQGLSKGLLTLLFVCRWSIENSRKPQRRKKLKGFSCDHFEINFKTLLLCYTCSSKYICCLENEELWGIVLNSGLKWSDSQLQSDRVKEPVYTCVNMIHDLITSGQINVRRTTPGIIMHLHLHLEWPHVIRSQIFLLFIRKNTYIPLFAKTKCVLNRQPSST